MSEVNAKLGDDELVLTVDDEFYPRDALYGAAYIFIDRCYVKLDRPSDKQVSVRLKLKPGVKRDLQQLAGEFENELLGQAWRRQITEENRTVVEQITTRALAGAAGPPGLDDLMDMDIDDDTAFEDPLGIAQSWEDKYKKKNPAEALEKHAADGSADAKKDSDPEKKA